MAREIRFAIFPDFTTNLQESPIYRESFREHSLFALLCQKVVLYSFSKFYIFEPLTNIQLHRRFKLGFWKTSEQVYKKVQH